jgi:peroxiredoxin
MTRSLRRLSAACSLILLALGCASTLTAEPAAPSAKSSKAASKRTELVGVGTGFRALPFGEVVDLAGNRHSFADYQGKVLVLHFWASWCPYCRTEVDELKTLSGEEWADQGVAVLTVSTDQDTGKLKQFIKDQELSYPIVIDQDQDVPIGEQYGVTGIPATLIITRDGVIGLRMPGAGEIIENVKTVLKESPTS